MPNRVTIDVEARFVDNVSQEAEAAGRAVRDVGRQATAAGRQVNQLGRTKASPRIDVDNRSFINKIRDAENRARNLGKTKTSMILSAVDKASSVISKIVSKAKSISGKTWRSIVSINDSQALKSLRQIGELGKGIAGKTWSATLRVVDMATSPLRTVKNMLFSIKSLILAITAGLAANKFIFQPIGLADAYSSAKIGFSTLLGNAAGQQMMNDLDDFARSTPFKTSEVIANSQKMLAMGWEAKDIIKDMTTIGDAAAATGKGDEGLNRIILALSQIKSKGKLSTEELNQLAEAGISAKRYLAEGLGYGSGDKGLMNLSKDLEQGKIGSETAIQAILQGMKEYEGMMSKTANETVSGLKSQIEDTFEINTFRRWGQGLQDGAKKGLGSVVKLLNASEEGLISVGDTLYELGKTASNWVADKLWDAVKTIQDITSSSEFKSADLGGKVKMLWSGVVGDPVSEWWSTTVVPWWNYTAVPWIEDKAASAGKMIGTGMTQGLMALFGAGDTLIDGTEQGAGIAGSFVKGFVDGFDGSAITNAFVKAIADVWNSLPGWAQALIGGYAITKGAGALSSLVSGVQNFAGLAKGFIGSTGTAMSKGTGLLSVLAGAGYAASGGAAASTLSGGAAAALGAPVIAGIGTGVISGGLGLYDTITGFATDDATKMKAGMWEAGGGLGGMAAGAAIGTLLGGPLIGTAIGGLIGGGIGLYQGYKIKKEAKEAAEEAEKLARAEAEAAQRTRELAAIDLDKRFGDITLSAEELQAAVNELIGQDLIDRANANTDAINKMETAYSNLEAANASLKKDLWTPTLGTARSEAKLATEEITKLTESYKTFSDSATEYLDEARYASSSAISTIISNEEEAQKVLDASTAFFDERNSKITESTDAMNAALTDALSDGVITIDEEKSLQKMRQQITDILAQIKDDEYQANMNVVRAKYTDPDISLGSFEDLMNQGADAASAVEEGFWTQFGQGSLGVEQGSEAWNTLLKGTLDSISAAWDEVGSLGIEKIQSKWSDELGSLTGSFSDIMSNSKEDIIQASDGLSDETRINLEKMLETMKPTTEQMQEIADSYAELGQAVPEAISNYLQTEEFYAALASGTDSMAEYLKSHKISIEPELEVNPIYEYTQYESDKLIPENTGLLPEVSVEPKYSYQKFNMNQLIDSSATLRPNITISPNYNYSGAGSARGNVWYPSGTTTKGYANGGIVRGGSRLVKVAEEGSPEVIIPTSSQRRDRGIKLWKKAGQMLGVDRYARGGLTNGGDEGIRFRAYGSDGETANVGKNIQIDMGGVNVQIQIDATGNDNIVAAIAAQKEEIAEAVAGIMADAFGEQFENTPTRGGVA